MLYQLSYTRLSWSGGESRIRTCEVDRQQIYSLPQLAALVSPRNQHVKDELVIRFELTTG